MFNFFKKTLKSKEEPKVEPKVESKVDSKKEPKTEEKSPFESLENWRCEYIYGFIGKGGDPYQKIPDRNVIVKILEDAVGKGKGFIGMDSTLHPYNLVNEKGFTAWDLAWIKVRLQNEGKALREIAENRSSVIVDVEPLGLKGKFIIWPNDSLDPRKYTDYSICVPFVFPYLVYKSEKDPYWKENPQLDLDIFGFLNSLNSLFSKYINYPVMALGYGVFDRDNLDDMIEKYTSYYEKNIKDRE